MSGKKDKGVQTRNEELRIRVKKLERTVEGLTNWKASAKERHEAALAKTEAEILERLHAAYTEQIDDLNGRLDARQEVNLMLGEQVAELNAEVAAYHAKVEGAIEGVDRVMDALTGA